MLLYCFILILILINVFIVITGKTYLYKAIASTYLKGKSSPTIYDLDIFPSTILKSGKHEKLKLARYYNSYKVSKEDQKILDDLGTTSFLVYKDDELIFEKYFDKHTAEMKSNSFSMAKSLIGILIFIAKEEGLINSLDDKISNYLPFVEKECKITVKHLLTMTSGMVWSESRVNPLSENAEAYYTSELDKFMSTIKFKGTPGEIFDYKSGNSQLLGMILKRVTKTSVSKYAEKKVWKKLGAESEAQWSLDHEDGIEKTFCCLYATSKDYLKLGRMILNDGVANGNKILSKESVEELLKLPENVTEVGLKNYQYTNHIWKYGNIDYFRGLFGQYIIVDKTSNMIVVRTGQKRMDKYLFCETDDEKSMVNLYKDGHPKDLFIYLRLAKEIVKK